jgi:hypothetical protein
MAFYLKIKNNVRILHPGDFFIGADGLNHTYNELENLNDIDLSIMGVHTLNIDELPSYQQSVLRARVDEQKDLQTINSFYFRNINYPCSAKDIAMVNTQLSLLSIIPMPSVGDVNWVSPNTPFYLITSNGELNEFDAQTFIEFAKAMTLHVYTHKICAEILLAKSDLEEADITDVNNWPSVSKSHLENYEYFSNQLITIKNAQVNTSLLNEIDQILTNDA